MAVTSHYTSPRDTFLPPLASWFHTLRERIARHRSYRRTLNELSALSAHQLADLGLHRSGLHQAAYQATYHQFR